MPITHYHVVVGGPLHLLELTVYMHEPTSQLQSSEWVKRPAPFGLGMQLGTQATLSSMQVGCNVFVSS